MVAQFMVCALIATEHNKGIKNKLNYTIFPKALYAFVGIF